MGERSPGTFTEMMWELSSVQPLAGRHIFGECGETPARAVERLRVEASKARIVHSREPIEAIAMSLGFADPERMRRAFVRRFGRSPRDFRRSAFDAAQEAV